MASTGTCQENGQGTAGEDGGRRGWIAVLTIWFRNFLWVGAVKGLGIMLPVIQQQMDTQTWVIGWITAGVPAVNGLVAPFAVLLSKKFESGYVVIACGLVTGLSAITASLTSTPFQLAMLYTIPTGSSLGVLDVVCKEAVGRCFTKNYATASGFARTGHSLGLFVCAPLVQLFLNTYGWRGALLLTGAFPLHLVVCGYLMVTARLPRSSSHEYERVSEDDHDHTQETGRAGFLDCCATFWRQAVKNFDLKLLYSVRFWGLAGINCTAYFAFTLWVVYFVSQAQSNGFSILEASTMVTVAGVANLIAKLLQGFITDRGLMSSWSLAFICATVNSVAYGTSSWLTAYWAMMTSAALILFNSGVLSCQCDVIIKEFLGVEWLAGAFGWIGISNALLLLTMGFLPGWLYDVTGNYGGGFVMIGCVQALGVFSLLSLKKLPCASG